MPATGHRRGNLVYHWKHGYIPLDHFAALQKAHGSHKGAAKLMEKHGISGGHDHNVKALDVRKDAKGYRVVHKPSDMPLSTGHSTKGGAEAAMHEYAATPHNLHVSADELRNNKGVMDHLQAISKKQYQIEGDKKREASMVVAAKRQRPAGPKVSNPAKPGDLVVVSRDHSSWVNGQGRTVTEEHTPGIVTHVHSDGTPIAYRDARGSFSTVQPRDATRTVPQGEIDAHGFMGHVAATNKWSGGQSKAHYDSLDKIVSEARKFRRPSAKAAAQSVPTRKFKRPAA